MSANATLDMGELTKQLESVFGKKLDEFSSEQKAALEKAVGDKFKAFQDDWERKNAVHSLPGSADEKHKGQKYSLVRSMAGLVNNDWSVCPMERAMHDALKAKAMSFGTDGAGGFLVPNEVLVSEIIPLLYAESVCMQLGATILNGLTKAPIQIPRVSGGTTAYWIGEGATITASDLTIQQLQLTPHGLAALTVVSDLLTILDSPSVENMVRMDMARKLALKLDLGILKGSGAGGEPQGIDGYTGVNTATLTDPTTYDELLAFVSEVRADNALSGKLGWAISNADMLEMEQMKDKVQPPATAGDGDVNVQPLGSRMLLTGTASDRRLLEYPVKVSTQLADGDVYFGNWADVIVAQWGGLRLEATNAVGFTTAQNHIRALTYVDSGLRHPQSFCVPT
jgi:HK97 family phage major capsid protein